MTREGIVCEVKGRRAFIAPSDSSECDSCEAKHACHALSGGKEEDSGYWVINEIGAAKGDRVKLELSPSASITIILSTFLVPVLLLFAGYLFMLNGSDTERAIGAGIGLAAGILLAMIINRRMRSKDSYNVRITRILKNNGDSI
ncbi:MAG: hypothetical protein GF388_03335 [Candidatus Aegiribacteria sp.]|nr:hypothetical protein [Candidatus Aegiribacteria sp.]MBD3294300.1 hypothetical protein [Candidatus Fermentibacteria bacterium]